MTILVSGSAGFIGYHLSKRLLSEGNIVIGVDNINNYYNPQLKEDRLNKLVNLSTHYNSYHTFGRIFLVSY